MGNENSAKHPWRKEYRWKMKKEDKRKDKRPMS